MHATAQPFATFWSAHDMAKEGGGGGGGDLCKWAMGKIASFNPPASSNCINMEVIMTR